MLENIQVAMLSGLDRHALFVSMLQRGSGLSCYGLFFGAGPSDWYGKPYGFFAGPYPGRGTVSDN